MKRVALIACSLALAACSGGNGGDGAAPAPAKSPQPDIAADVAPGENQSIDLQAGGLSIPPQGGNEALDVPFGSRCEAAEATLATALGEVKSRSQNAECPSGPLQMTRYEGLTLTFRDDEFVGWFASDPYLPPETRLSLLATGGIEMVEGSSLGEQFRIGEESGPAIFGRFDGEGDEARVESLWAGENCLLQ